MHFARFVGEEAALASRSYLVGNRGDRIRANRSIYFFARGIGEGVAALASAGEIIVESTCAAALRVAAQRGQVRGEAHVGVAAGVNHLCFIDRADAVDRRRLVGRDRRFRQLRDGEGGDDEDDGDDDQKLDERESALSITCAHKEPLSGQPTKAATRALAGHELSGMNASTTGNRGEHGLTSRIIVHSECDVKASARYWT